MSRTARLWKGAGALTLAGLVLLGGALARGADETPPLTEQLLELGRQALDQGHPAVAEAFFQNALTLDPQNAEAQRALNDDQIVRVAQQPPDDEAFDLIPGLDPVIGADVPERDARATIERAIQQQQIRTQQLTSDVDRRLQQARDLLNAGRPEDALAVLRLAQTMVRADVSVPEDVRTQLDRRIQAQLLFTAREEQRIVQSRAERARLLGAANQRTRVLNELATRQEQINALMTQFDSLMLQGQYNVLASGGLGDITANTAPYFDARLLAQEARALAPSHTAPRAGVFVAQTVGFLAQALAFEEIKEYRFMLTLQDVDRAAIPFPDTITIEYPDAEEFREMSERRIARWGEAVDLLARDERTQAIVDKLNQPVTMPFPDETPLEEVLQYIKEVTRGPNDSGIPIYYDPVSFLEQDRSIQSPVQIDLEGIPLKTSLRLLLRQLGLTYTVKDGLLTITPELSEDQPTEIRVYPVADLSVIPMSLMGGGMMGGMGGMGMGGMGGGMGGMGMGGMGGGMGGMGMGGMGGGMGMMSVPPSPVSASDEAAQTFSEKKSN